MCVRLLGSSSVTKRSRLLENPLSCLVSPENDKLIFLHPLISRICFQVMRFLMESSKQMYRTFPSRSSGGTGVLNAKAPTPSHGKLVRNLTMFIGFCVLGLTCGISNL